MTSLEQLAMHAYAVVSAGVATPAGLALIFLLMAVGEAGISGPLVMEGVLLAVGVGLWETSWAALAPVGAAMAGSLAGASVIYVLSERSSALLYRVKWMRRHLEGERVASLVGKLSGSSVLTLASLRFLPGFVLLASIAAGIARVPYRTFALAVVIADALWISFLLVSGVVLSRFLPGAQGAHAFWLGLSLLMGVPLMLAGTGFLLRLRSRSPAVQTPSMGRPKLKPNED